MSVDWKWPGARWWRCDLHVHSPASHDFKGSATAEDWVRAAVEADLSAVAVTDHNTASMVEEIARAAQDFDITVFPGVELTVSDGTHLLALFPPGTPADRINAFLGKCGHQSPGEDTPASCSYVDALASAEAAVFIAPHITTAKGIYKQLNFGQPLMKILRDDRLDAVEVNDGFDQIEDQEDAHKLRKALAGNIPDYQRSRGALPVLVSSDAHTLQAIGRQSTWIKMTEPTLEGLRLALQDGQPLSIRNIIKGGDENPNRHADCVIEGIEVDDLRYVGRGETFEVTFNPWLNAIIGGRGTGKSTLVECLRLCFRREDELPKELRRDLSHFFETYQSRNDRGLLTEESAIRVVYRKDRQRFRLQWRQTGEGPIIQREVDPGEWKSEPGVVRERFPVRLYSQKQIFELARDSAALLGIIDEAPEVKHGEWKAEWDRKASRYLSLRSRARELRSQTERVPSLEGELADVKRKLEVFEQSGHAEILRRYQHRRRELREIERWLDELGKLGDRVRKVAEETSVDPPEASTWQEETGREAIIELVQGASAEFHNFEDRLEKIAREMDERVEKARVSLERSTWRASVHQATVDYEKLKERLAREDVEDPTEYGRLVQRRQSIDEDLASLRTLDGEVVAVEEEAEKLRDDLGALRREITRRRSRFLESVLPDGEGLVQARIVPYGDQGSVEAELRELLEKRDHYEKDFGQAGSGGGIVGRLYPGETTPEMESFEKRLEAEKQRLQHVHEGGEDDEIRDKRFADHLRSLPPERIDRLKVWCPADALEISYSPSADGKGFRSIDHASPGQKTAALLTFLLSYGTEPIILDQPEDDLDNHLIYDLLVQRIRDMKVDRQVIVVTHNPNIVVHGDAELVISLDQQGGCTRISSQGGLQEADVRGEVCTVMEGGEEALRRRYQRIAETSVRSIERG